MPIRYHDPEPASRRDLKEKIEVLRDDLDCAEGLQEMLLEGLRLREHRLEGVDETDIGKVTGFDADTLGWIWGLTDDIPFPWGEDCRNDMPTENLVNVNKYIETMDNLNANLSDPVEETEGAAELETWFQEQLKDWTTSLDPENAHPTFANNDLVAQVHFWQSKILLGRSVRRFFTDRTIDGISLPNSARTKTRTRFQQTAKKLVSKTLTEQGSQNVLKELRGLLSHQSDWIERGIPAGYIEEKKREGNDVMHALPLGGLLKRIKREFKTGLSHVAMHEMAEQEAQPSSSGIQSGEPQAVTSTMARARTEGDQLEYTPTFDGEAQAKYSSDAMAILGEYHQQRVVLGEEQSSEEESIVNKMDQKKIMDYFCEAYVAASRSLMEKSRQLRVGYLEEDLAKLERGAAEWRDYLCESVRLEELRLMKHVAILDQDFHAKEGFEDWMTGMNSRIEKCLARAASFREKVRATPFEGCQTWEDFRDQASQAHGRALCAAAAKEKATQTSGANEHSAGTQKKSKKGRSAAQKAQDKEFAARRARQEKENSDTHMSTFPKTVPPAAEDNMQIDQLSSDWTPVSRGRQRRNRSAIGDGGDSSDRTMVSVSTDADNSERAEGIRSGTPKRPETRDNLVVRAGRQELTAEVSSAQDASALERHSADTTKVQSQTFRHPAISQILDADSSGRFLTDREIVRRGLREEVSESSGRELAFLERLSGHGMVKWQDGGVSPDGEPYLGGFQSALPPFFSNQTEPSQGPQEE